MKVSDTVKWLVGGAAFKGRTFEVVRFEYRDRKLVAVCKLKTGGPPVLGHPYAPTIAEDVDYVFALDELQVVP